MPINKKFHTDFIVKETHLDVFGHMNNATYLVLFEDARWDLLSESGYGLDFIKESGLGPVILEINIKYLKELRARQAGTIETSCLSYKGKVGKMIQKILVKNEVCAEAEITFGLFSLSKRKMVEPTQQWLETIGIQHAVE